MKPKPYRPANGTEGMDFMARWCERCIHDDYEKLKFCQILGATLAFYMNDPEYPREWIYDESGKPCCTAFEEK